MPVQCICLQRGCSTHVPIKKARSKHAFAHIPLTILKDRLYKWSMQVIGDDNALREVRLQPQSVGNLNIAEEHSQGENKRAKHDRVISGSTVEDCGAKARDFRSAALPQG
ncbi:uncharacterized protein CC84DRAFT_1163624 [Paraphaeosphaeria sporulosa]|uniref:Uncharacterized protein n=1 Tax=Paraphaeosphaeria sporulosa TaxID=1460663 RepID=A0A177CIX6_9PLEO|nr:uncharacterized protein CC84DRAFT_1163624 [Paraphaeosphaeria sporulosa]OAG07474.1 hypothetical protein CC84DRAFT_1163624 [Paraphaeosphaeria sporulosa]